MSGSIFLTGSGNAAEEAFDRTQRRFQEAQDREQRTAVDAALRRGIAQGAQPSEAPSGAFSIGGPPPRLQMAAAAPAPSQAPAGRGAAVIGAPYVGQTTSPAPAPAGGTDYSTQLRGIAQQHGVDPELAVNVMGAESSGRPDVYGPVTRSGERAGGLMQLMPGTARDLGVTDVMDPTQNMTGGVRYLRQMSDRYGGNLMHTLAAYNWGPGNVDKWLQAGGDFSQLPAETQAYIQKITGNAVGRPGMGGGAQPAGAANISALTAAAGLPPTASSGMPQNPDRPSIYEPILQELSGVQGGGAMALQILQLRNQDEQSRMRFAAQESRAARQEKTRMATLAMTALAKGDLQTYQYWQQQAGIPPVPPEVMRNAEQRALLAQASVLTARHYGDDPQQAQVFLKAFIESGGNAMRAIEVAGPPRSKPNFQAHWVTSDQQDWQQLILIDRNNPTAAPVVPRPPGQQQPAPGGGAGAVTPPAQGQPGAPPQGGYFRRTPGTAGAAGRTLDREARRQMLINGGLSEQEANLVAGGGTVTPNAILSFYGRLQQQVADDFTLRDPAAKKERLEKTMTELFGPTWAQALSGRRQDAPQQGATQQSPAAAAPAPAAAPQGPPQRPPSVPVGSQYSPSRRQWRDRNGNIYDAQGNPA